MPNWCSNSVAVTGPTADVDRFLYQAKGEHDYFTRSQIPGDGVPPEGRWVREPGFFWNFVTPPASIMNPEAYFSVADGSEPGTNWYNWNSEHWGTKWDVTPEYPDSYLEPAVNGIARILIVFETAWAPPTPVIAAMAEQYPMLAFEHGYDEEGNSYWGNVTYADGVEVTRTEGECDHAWYIERYGFCPFVEWDWGSPGDECPDCGEKIPEDDETATEAST